MKAETATSATGTTSKVRIAVLAGATDPNYKVEKVGTTQQREGRLCLEAQGFSGQLLVLLPCPR